MESLASKVDDIADEELNLLSRLVGMAIDTKNKVIVENIKVTLMLSLEASRKFITDIDGLVKRCDDFLES